MKPNFNPDLNLVRDLLKKVYLVVSEGPEGPLVLSETYALSPRGNDCKEPETDPLAHVHLMVERGLLVFTNKIKSNRESDFATIEPTEKAKQWAYCAYDDAKWQQVEGEITDFLTQGDSEA